MVPIIQANLIVSGAEKFNPALMCDELRVQPNQVWKIGDKIGKTIRLQDTNGWMVSTEKLETYDVDEALRRLLVLLGGVTDALSALSSKYPADIEISVSVELKDEMPSINFSEDLIAIISRMKASLDVALV